MSIEMKALHYNFDKVARIPAEMYERLWATDRPFQEDPNIIDEISDYIGTDIYEVNTTLY